MGVLHGQPGEGHTALLAIRQVLDWARLDTQPQVLAPDLLSDWCKLLISAWESPGNVKFIICLYFMFPFFSIFEGEQLLYVKTAE